VRTNDGSVFGWGRENPVPCRMLSSVVVASVSAGAAHSMALSATGQVLYNMMLLLLSLLLSSIEWKFVNLFILQVFVWGSSSAGQLGLGDVVSTVEAVELKTLTAPATHIAAGSPLTHTHTHMHTVRQTLI
jgi:alpha-tubulin suppressor-like RCC1 family protein